MAFFAWFTFDTLRSSGAGLVACAGAGGVATGLSLAFFAAVEAIATSALALGVSHDQILEFYAVTFAALVVNLLIPLKKWPTTFIRWAFDLALFATDMTKVGTWNPVLRVARILFILTSLAYVLCRIDYYHDIVVPD